MSRPQWISPVMVAILVAIGCGSSTPQDASATMEETNAAPADAAPSAGGEGGATVDGTVWFQGRAPEPKKVKMDADPICLQQHTEDVFNEDIVVNDNGTLKNVFIYVKEGVQGSSDAPTEPVVLNQAGCWYTPHILAIRVNQPLNMVNSDSTLHNVNAKPKVNRPFNIAQPVKGMETTKKFTKPEIGVKFKCNVHPWMSAYAMVMEHPFYSLSDNNGLFSITGLPAGTYTIEAWHEELGTQTQTVTVADGESATVDMTFQGK
jgi:plastocyanin